MCAKKKTPIAKIERQNNRYSFFDNEGLSILEKRYFLEYALKNNSLEEILNKNYKYPTEKLIKKREFRSEEHKKLYTDDLTRFLNIIVDSKSYFFTLDNKKDVLKKVNSLDNNTEEIIKYLEGIVINTKSGNVGSIASFIHHNNFTYTKVLNPYEREKSPYKEHIRHLVEIDFFQSKEDVLKYVSSIYDSLNNELKKDEYTTKATKMNFYNANLNYGDYLFIIDCKKLNITQQDTVNEINMYREYTLMIDERISVKRVNDLLKKINENDINLELYNTNEDGTNQIEPKKIIVKIQFTDK